MSSVTIRRCHCLKTVIKSSLSLAQRANNCPENRSVVQHKYIYNCDINMSAELENLPTNARSLDFYGLDASSIPNSSKELLTTYAGIPPEEINQHVDTIREKAFRIFPYPCIGMYRFLNLGLPQSPVYEEVLERVRKGETFLDLGCCFGQEIRNLIVEGARPENCYGSDLRQEFIDLGFDLFQDRDRQGSKINWLVGNIFDDDSSLSSIKNQISIIYTGSFFHLFNWEEQFDIAKRVVSLLKPEPGVLICGRQVGNENPGLYTSSGYTGERQRYRHNIKSWTEFWDEVGEATGTNWKVDAELNPFGGGFGSSEQKLVNFRREDGAKILKFVIRRV
ncbi:uncharacterized protein PV09_02540 [Verruconis gallopava]|uniref:Methyltransferase domain-containing protein n=1 Tax=Verruconis gallopava TaxID=253628 RepID=A0A0D2B6J8_9PEZI|nr:uncharacterized protein PV09_02540 [Verruconis gallopava]KIW06864.1 hypothetical protein PV09_02540 [Verruconis gallopava]